MARPDDSTEHGAPDVVGDGVVASGAAPAPSGAMQRSEEHLDRPDGARLFNTHWRPLDSRSHTGALEGPSTVVMHGFGEHSGRYDAFAEFLVSRGHAVLRMDARGHGRSDGARGHVVAFDDYVEDLAAFASEGVRREPARPLVLFGHSNGGLTAIRALQRGLIQPRALVLTSPLLRLRKRPVPDALARLLSWATPSLPLPNGIRSDDLTHDPELRAAHRRDPWVHDVATPRWYWSMTLAQRLALAEAPSLTLPVLTVCAELDPLVDPAATLAFHQRLGSREKQLIFRRGEFHEVLNEVDRHDCYERIAAWVARVLGLDEPARDAG